MFVKRSYLVSQSLIRFLIDISKRQHVQPHAEDTRITDLGIATTSVSMNSLFSTKSSFLTTSSNDRCDKLPLSHISWPSGLLRLPLQSTYARLRCRFVKLPLTRLYDCVLCFCTESIEFISYHTLSVATFPALSLGDMP